MRLLATTVMLALLPAIAVRAQPAEAWRPRADVTATIGWFTASRDEPGQCCSDWSSSLFKGLSTGYYWTDHLKTELEIGWPGPTEAFGYTTPPRTPTSATSFTYDEHVYRGVKFSASQAYQFGRNAHFHPFAGAGIDVDREEDAITRTTQPVAGRPVSRVELREIEVRTRPFVTTGFKAYFSERAFFRTEIKVGFSEQIEQVVWKSGLGFDFGAAPARHRAAAREPRAAAPRAHDPPEIWRAYVTKLPIGSVVKVRTGGSGSFVASLLAVEEDGVVLKPKARIAEPVRHVPFDSLERLALYNESTANDRAGAIAAAIGTGAGTFYLMLAALLSQLD